jgi:hypothetical protein
MGEGLSDGVIGFVQVFEEDALSGICISYLNYPPKDKLMLVLFVLYLDYRIHLISRGEKHEPPK